MEAVVDATKLRDRRVVHAESAQRVDERLLGGALSGGDLRDNPGWNRDVVALVLSVPLAAAVARAPARNVLAGPQVQRECAPLPELLAGRGDDPRLRRRIEAATVERFDEGERDQ